MLLSTRVFDINLNVLGLIWQKHVSVLINNGSTSSASLYCGVPQGSIAGPLLLSATTQRDFNSPSISTFNCYVDILQIYLPLKLGNNHIHNFLPDGISAWKQGLNHHKRISLVQEWTKTEYIFWFGLYATININTMTTIFSGQYQKQIWLWFLLRVSGVKSSFYQLTLDQPNNSLNKLDKAT